MVPGSPGKIYRVVNLWFTISENPVAGGRVGAATGEASDMRINGYTSISNVQSRAQKRRAGEQGTQFAPESASETPAAAAGASASPLGGIDALLALQEVEDPLAERRRSARHGRDLLDTLDQLKADLLAGRVATDRLERLAAQLSRRRPGSDPQLESLLDEIDLRARVELAKLGVYVD